MSWVRIPSVTLLPSLTTSCCEGFFLFSHSPPTFLLFLSFVDSSSAQCASCNEMPVRVAAFVSRPRLFAASALPVVPRLLGCSPFFGAACACAHERRARVGDIGVNLSARSPRESREPTKTCSLSRDLWALRAAAVLRFPPVNEFAPRARIYTRASVAFRFLSSFLHRVAHWVGC